jgi:hypothetical protein
MKKTFFLLSIFLFSIHYLKAQEEKVKNLQKYDRKLLHFGFTIGLNSADFYIRNADDFFTVKGIGDIYSVSNVQSLGFHLGPISDLRLGDNFNLRFLVNLTFCQRDLSYTVLSDTTSTGSYVFTTHDMKLASTFVEFPLLLKYRAKRINNYRPYIIGGINYKMDLASKKKIKEEEMPKIRLLQNDIYYEIGFGIDFYTQYFKFSPEIKFGVGLNNVMVPDNTPYTSSIKYIKSNVVMLSFHFE